MVSCSQEQAIANVNGALLLRLKSSTALSLVREYLGDLSFDAPVLRKERKRKVLLHLCGSHGYACH